MMKRHKPIGMLLALGCVCAQANTATTLEASSLNIVPCLGQAVYRDIKLFGTIESAKKSLLSTSIDGEIKTVEVMPGQRVAKGDVLLQLDPQAAQTKLEKAIQSQKEAQHKLKDIVEQGKKIDAQYAKEQHILALAEKYFERQKKLRDHEVITKVQLEDAAFRRDEKKAVLLQTRYQQALLHDQKLAFETEHARATAAQKSAENWLKRQQIKAPFAGKIEEVVTQVGQKITKHSPVATLVDNQHFQVRAVLSHAEVAELKKQQRSQESIPVTLRIGQKHIAAKIKSVLPSSKHDLVGVDMILEAGAEIESFCGEKVDFMLHMPTGQRRYVVPEAALYHDHYVHVLNAQQSIERVPVTAEKSAELEAEGKVVLITHQLPSKAQIIVQSPSNLVPGMRVVTKEVAS